MYEYGPPKNYNDYLHDVEVDINMDICLLYYDELKEEAKQYTDSVHETDSNWKIVRMKEFNIADDIMQQLGLKDFVKDYRPRFYSLDANTYLMNHIDHNTLCSINIIIGDEDDKPAPVIFEGGEMHKRPEGGLKMHYKSALFNTTKMHGVINDNEDRILLKISIFDKTYDECRDQINSSKSDHVYNSLASEKKYQPFRDLCNSLPYLGIKKYFDLHKDLMTPTNIKIDLDLFHEEIKQYQDKFEQWGVVDFNPKRYGMALSQSKKKILSTPNPANWPMDIWNINNPNDPLLDTSFIEPTDAFTNIKSLNPLLTEWKQHLARSNILLWNNGSRFMPHIDVFPPFTNLRLWGTNDPKNYYFMFWNPDKNKYERVENIEPGRIYLADTSKWHHAYSTADNNYTFFIALQVSAYDKIKQSLI